jgi:hypothetical protein
MRVLNAALKHLKNSEILIARVYSICIAFAKINCIKLLIKRLLIWRAIWVIFGKFFLKFILQY